MTAARRIATRTDWVDERALPGGSRWGTEYGRLIDDGEVIGFERLTDGGPWYVDVYVPDWPHSAEEARRLAAALLAAGDEVDARNGALS